MNIRVDLNTPITTEVVFRSPVDCSQVTGLIVYYIGADGNTASQEFAFADAHGNNVGDIDHLFAENAVVKVILDVTTSMAFVQNADTNAYLEGRFDGIIDQLCPSFTESGAVVACEPVGGYPLEVVSGIVPVQSGSGDPSPDNIRPISGHSEVKLTRCGKNLIDPTEYMKSTGNTTLDGDVFTTTIASGGQLVNRYSTAKHHPAGTYTASIIPVDGDVYATLIVYDQATGNVVAKTPYGNENQINTKLTFTASAPFRVTVCGPQDTTKYGTYSYRLQLEPNTTATAYEPFRGNEFALDLGQTVYGGSLDWSTGVLTVGWAKWILDNSVEWQHGSSPNEAVLLMCFPCENLGMPRENTAYCSHFARGYGDSTVGQFWVNPSTAVRYNVRFMVPQTLVSSKAEWLAYIAEHPIELCYELADPFAIQLTPQEILALSGVNTLYSSTGETIVSGKADPKAMFEKLTNAIIALGGNV